MSESSTPKRATTKKKKAPRAAFVVTVAAAAVVASACSSVVESTDECPASAPVAGDACSTEEACSYGGNSCSTDFECGEDGTWLDVSPPCNPPPPEVPCEERLDQPCTDGETCEGEDYGCGPTPLECVDGVWIDQGLSCNPPPPCPLDVPVEGEPCPNDFGTPQDCFYEVETACGPTQVQAVCEFPPDGQPVWTFIAPPCEPKTPDCEGYSSVALCQADVSCRWLIPGCAEPPSDFAIGCYPAADCDANSCPLDQACGTVVFNPCFDSKCNACGADAQICLPSDATN